MLREVGERLKLIRLLTGLSRDEFSSKHTFSVHTLQSLELGRLRLSEKNLGILKKIFLQEDIVFSDGWLYEGKGSFPYKTNQLAISGVKRPDGSDVQDFDEDLFILEEGKLFCSRLEGSLIVKISDNKMSPCFKAGDFVGARLVDRHTVILMPDEFYLLEVASGKHMVRRAIQENDKLVFKTMDSELKNQALDVCSPELIKIGKVIWHRIPLYASCG